MTDSTSTTAGPDPTTTPPPVRAGWVPVDQRVAGLDRRSIWPAAVLLVVWVVWAHAVPWIDSRISVDNPVAAGQVIDLGEGAVTFVPAVGWELESGTPLTPGEGSDIVFPASALVSSEGVSYVARSGRWDGSPAALADRVVDVDDSLNQLLTKDEQGRSAITNADGVPGEVVYVVGVDEAVLVATFVFARTSRDGTESGSSIGVDIEVRGTPDQLQGMVEDVAAMIATTRYRPAIPAVPGVPS